MYFNVIDKEETVFTLYILKLKADATLHLKYVLRQIYNRLWDKLLHVIFLGLSNSLNLKLRISCESCHYTTSQRAIYLCWKFFYPDKIYLSILKNI